MLTTSQWNLLKAIAHEGILINPTSHKFIQKYQLGSSAATLRSLQSLLKYELIFVEFTDDNKK